MTLLEALCKINGQAGGTIHQFFGWRDWQPMARAYDELTRAGIEFSSKASFEKLAKQYHLTIYW